MINEARSALARAVEWSPSEQPDLRGRRVHNLVAMLLEAPDSEGPATIEQARGQLKESVSVYLDGGTAPGGVASTIVDITGDIPRVLRVGAVPLDRIRDVVGAVEDATAR